MNRLKCNECGKTFRRRDYLQRHQASHTNARPFNCSICEISFNRKDLLDKHLHSRGHHRKSDLKSKKLGSVFVNAFVGQNEFHTAEKLQQSQVKVDDPVEDEATNVPASRANELRKAETLSLRSPVPDAEATRNANPTTSPIWNIQAEDPKSRVEFINLMNLEDSYGWLFDGPETPIPPSLESDIDDSFHIMDPREVTTTDASVASEFVLPEILQTKLVQFIQNNFGSVNPQLLSPERISLYISRFYSCFDLPYPIVHKQLLLSGDPEDPTWMFLGTAVLTIGMAYVKHETEKFSGEYKLAIDIHDELHTMLLVQVDKYQNMNDAPLELLLTLLLTDFFTTNLGTVPQVRKANIIHPMIMSLLQELDMYVTGKEPPVQQEPTREEWLVWIRYESFKRIAYFGYLIDVQRSFFRCKNPCISLFDVQLEVPYTDAAWYANDAKEFAKQYFMQPRGLTKRTTDLSKGSGDPASRVIELNEVTANGFLIPNVKSESRWPNFLWSLRRLMQPFRKNQEEYHFNCFSQYTRFIMLHGVLSLVGEFRNMSVIDLGNIKERLKMMGGKLEQSFFTWNGYFNHNIRKVNEASLNGIESEATLNNYGTTAALWANILMLKMGLLGLYCDIGLLIGYRSTVQRLKASDDKSSIQSPPSPERIGFYKLRLAKSDLILTSWATTKSGVYSNIEACKILQILFFNEDLLLSIPHASFCLYISVLTCWFFQSNRAIDEMHAMNLPEFDIASQGEEIEAEAFKYISVCLDNRGKGLDTNVNYVALVKALALHSIRVLERSCQWACTNSYIDDLYSLLF